MRQAAWLLTLTLWVDSAPARAESLYSEAGYRPLAADAKASRIGDVITVQIFENSSASSSADTSTQRKNALSAGANVTNTARQFGMNFEASGTLGGSFEGGGTTQRANRLLATITVTVKAVKENGDLEVAGEQLLTVNDEQHKVRVEGRVRPQDVSSDNVVLSTRLTDARILYVGDGDLSERNKRAWWRMLLDFLGL